MKLFLAKTVLLLYYLGFVVMVVYGFFIAPIAMAIVIGFPSIIILYFWAASTYYDNL